MLVIHDPARSIIELGKTAMRRNRLSSPAAWLYKNDFFTGRILDYGCGYGDIKKFLPDLDVEQYDRYHYPERPAGFFDIVYCGYVLNVLPNLPDRQKVLRDIWWFLKPNTGKAYISVRRDERCFTSRTYNVHLSLPSVHKISKRYEIYLYPSYFRSA